MADDFCVLVSGFFFSFFLFDRDLDLEIRAYGILHVDDNDLEPKCLIGKILHENGSCFSLVSQMRLMFVFTFLNHPGTWVLQARDGLLLPFSLIWHFHLYLPESLEAI